jgi:sec-independent protein translocase protein TatA
MGTIILSMPGATEWVLIAAVVLLLFGGKKIPELMRGLGKGVKEFKDASKGVDDERKEEAKPAGELRNPGTGATKQPDPEKAPTLSETKE